MKLRFSPVVFGITYCIAYIAVLSKDAALFRYYPQTRQFSWGWAPLSDVGPGMAWYGLMASAAVAGIVLALILPHEKIALALRNRLWWFPLFAMVGCVYLMKQFFFR